MRARAYTTWRGVAAWGGRTSIKEDCHDSTLSPTTHTASCLVKYAKECKEMAAGANIAHATDVVASQKMSLG